MKRDDAIRNVAIALGMAIKNVERAADKLIQDKTDATEVIAHIKALAKSQPRKVKHHVSPYAKFDKYHKKKEKDMSNNIPPKLQAVIDSMSDEQITKILNIKHSASDVMEQMKGLEQLKEQLCNPKAVTIEGWVCRNGYYGDIKDSILHLFLKGEPFPDNDKPERVGKFIQMWRGANGLHLPSEMYPEVTWDSEPKRVKILITPIEEN